jgi:hypothetical protein
MSRTLVLVCLLAGVAVAQVPPTPAPQTTAFDIEREAAEADLTRTRTGDQKMPDYLRAQAQYIRVVLKHAESDCAVRLADADARMKQLESNPATPVVLLDAPGAMPALHYAIELARARCATPGAGRTAAFEAARKYAEQAVVGYRSMFDYNQMAIMQFNVAQASNALGDTPRAIRELEVAIELDRTYGLRNDARENFLTLRSWQKKEATEDEVAEFFKAFEPRSATLTFAWKPFRVTSTVQRENASVEGNSVSRTQYSFPVTGELKAAGEDLVFERKVGALKFTNAPSGDALADSIAAVVAKVLSRQATTEISAAGEFKALRDAEAFAKTVGDEATALIAATIPADDPKRAALIAAVDERLRPGIAAEVLAAKAREEFGLVAGIWRGATLTRNDWLEMPATLSMNGTPQVFIEHQLQFGLTRWLPCAPKMAADSCIEIVLEARPQGKAIEGVTARLAEAGNGRLDYRAATRMRLVVDPATLICYENETLKYSYLAISNKGKRTVEISSDRSLTKSAYKP